jgi:mono/diheme cytochrome c family protein
MPRPLIMALVLVTALTLVPLGYFLRARHTDSTQPRIQVIFDMDDQPRPGTQAVSPVFADGRASRPPVAGTVARGELNSDPVLRDGHVDSVFTDTSPLPITAELLARGRDRFGIYCAPCHGLGGRGDGAVHARAVKLGEPGWTQPADLSGSTTVERPIGEIYAIINDGLRNMPPGRSLMPASDRWAVAAYVRALQRAAHGTMDDVPAEVRPTLR